MRLDAYARLADTVEAMSSHRPYREALGLDKALAEIERGRGTAYYTGVVDVCLKVFREKGFKIPESLRQGSLMVTGTCVTALSRLEPLALNR